MERYCFFRASSLRIRRGTWGCCGSSRESPEASGSGSGDSYPRFGMTAKGIGNHLLAEGMAQHIQKRD